MQYQVQIDPTKLFAYGVTVQQITQQLAANNANAGGGFYSQGGQFYLRARSRAGHGTSTTSATS